MPLFGWLKTRRRNKIRAQEFPDTWARFIESNVAYCRRLNSTESKKLNLDVQVLVAEKNWEGCGGLEMTDEIRVTVAANIAILCLGFTDEYFDLVDSILVYPNAYSAPSHTSIGSGIVIEGRSNREGEAWYRGPVVLSWADVLDDGRRDHDGNNLVLHEFAHQLDMQNGRIVDGTPPLESPAQYEKWQATFESQFLQLAEDCRHGRQTVMDCYGATHIAEFFAVATECFFELPLQLRRHHGELYELLADFYRQDPLVRFESHDDAATVTSQRTGRPYRRHRKV